MKISLKQKLTTLAILVCCSATSVLAERQVDILGNLDAQGANQTRRLPSAGKWETIVQRSNFQISFNVLTNRCRKLPVVVAFQKTADYTWGARIYKANSSRRARSISNNKTLKFSNTGNLNSTYKIRLKGLRVDDLIAALSLTQFSAPSSILEVSELGECNK